MSKFLILFFFGLPSAVFASPHHCLDLFILTSTPEVLPIAQQISQDAAQRVEAELLNKGVKAPLSRGYAILAGTMIGSAVLTTYVGSLINPHLPFFSLFLTQVSTIGVFVVGAPIWEPLSAKFRQIAFGIRKDAQVSKQQSSPQLNSTWLRSQESYSINEQMSRNLISQFIFSAKQNLYEAHRAFALADRNYAADQIAEAAYRLRILFIDIAPNDPSVAAAVKTSFTNHNHLDSEFLTMILTKIESLDPQFSHPDVRSYYNSALDSWFN